MKYFVTGRVHPERADVSFSRIEMGVGDGNSAAASCDSSQIAITLNAPNIDGWIAAKIMADDIANIIVGALGFALGSGYRVEIIQVTEEDGTPHVFGVRPGAGTESTLGFTPHGPVFSRALLLSTRDIFFRLALRDFLRAIDDVTDCAAYCYRSIEGIKSAFASRAEGNGWDDMNAVLGTDRNTITTLVKSYADPIRHGNWIAAEPTDKYVRWKMLSLTRDILIKYMEYSETEETAHK